MKKSSYISPASQSISLEPAQMLVGSIRINGDEEQGIDNPDQIRTNKFEWDKDYWDDK